MSAPTSRIAGDFFGYLMLFRDAPDEQRPAVGALRNHLLGQLEAVRRSVPPGDHEAIQVALIAFADEVIMTSGWPGTVEWGKQTLSMSLLGHARLGHEFFERLAALPPNDVDVREVYYTALALGFQGEYAVDPSGLAQITRDTFERLRAARRATDVDNVRRLAPPAYEVAIQLDGRAGRSVWPRLLLIAAGTALVWGVAWVLMRWSASGVPVPGTGA